MPFPALRPLPFGAVRPAGWLAAQCRLLAAGLTGRLEDVWGDVGPHSAWRGGDGEAWERGPYYVRGLVALAHVLGDAALHDRARPWLDAVLASQRDDGALGPAANDDWWPRMPMVDALRWHHEASGDARIVPALSRWMRHQQATLPTRPLDLWAPMRGADAAAQALWLHARTGDATLPALADLLLAQTTDWTTEFRRDDPTRDFPLGHGVNRAMGLREPAVRFLRTGDAAFLAAARDGWATTMRHHGQPAGVFSCDELLHGRDPVQGAELCTVVELLSALGTLLECDAALWCADAVERLAWNALPAAIAPDGCSRQYFQQPNQVLCTPGARRFSVHHETDLLFGLETGYGCCTANLHLAWPLVVRGLWARTADDGLAATGYGPCAVTAAVRGTGVTVVAETTWPFEEAVTLHVRADAPVAFPLLLRVPGWAGDTTVEVNGDPAPVPPARPAWLRLERTWRSGDVVTLRCAATVARVPAGRGAVHVARGPLVFSLPVGEDWRVVGGTPPFADHELHPTTPWAVGLGDDGPATVERGPVGRQPWTTTTAPLRLRVGGAPVQGWTLEDGSAGPVPERPVAAGAAERLLLVPYGAARLRVTCLPVLRD